MFCGWNAIYSTLITLQGDLKNLAELLKVASKLVLGDLYDFRAACFEGLQGLHVSVAAHCDSVLELIHELHL